MTIMLVLLIWSGMSDAPQVTITPMPSVATCEAIGKATASLAEKGRPSYGRPVYEAPSCKKYPELCGGIARYTSPEVSYTCVDAIKPTTESQVQP